MLAGLAARTVAERPDRGTSGAGDLAGSWELLAVCLQAGLPVATAVSVATEPLTGPVGDQLRRLAGLLALGADPAAAWAGIAGGPRAGASSRAPPAARPAPVRRWPMWPAPRPVRLRADLLDSAQARAQRAAVLITGPLGLCFLPAFLVLGIAPVVIGLAREALAQW